jgi:cytochrome c-type biogenesis protein CcmE
MNTYWKFGILITAVVAALVVLALGGIDQTKTYYHTVKELNTMGEQAKAKKLRVSGNVAAHSIARDGRTVKFTLVEEGVTLPVEYAGMDPLPDTFKDGAQALVEGRLESDGQFTAEQVQAKCASKYEASPTGTASPAPANAPAGQTMNSPNPAPSSGKS